MSTGSWVVPSPINYPESAYQYENTPDIGMWPTAPLQPCRRCGVAATAGIGQNQHISLQLEPGMMWSFSLLLCKGCADGLKNTILDYVANAGVPEDM